MQNARQIATDQFVSVRPETTIGQAINQLLEENTLSLVVLSADDQLIGTLSESICLRAAIDSHLRMDPVSIHMSRQFASVSELAPIDVVLDQFVLHDLQFLPVIDASGTVSGVITRQDLLRVVFGNAETSVGQFVS